MIIVDDIDDGVASSFDNRFTKDDEWSGNKKGDGANASEYECSKSGNK